MSAPRNNFCGFLKILRFLMILYTQMWNALILSPVLCPFWGPHFLGYTNWQTVSLRCSNLWVPPNFVHRIHFYHPLRPPTPKWGYLTHINCNENEKPNGWQKCISWTKLGKPSHRNSSQKRHFFLVGGRYHPSAIQIVNISSHFPYIPTFIRKYLNLFGFSSDLRTLFCFSTLVSLESKTPFSANPLQIFLGTIFHFSILTIWWTVFYLQKCSNKRKNNLCLLQICCYFQWNFIEADIFLNLFDLNNSVLNFRWPYCFVWLYWFCSTKMTKLMWDLISHLIK